jgi:hypothetical protein
MTASSLNDAAISPVVGHGPRAPPSRHFGGHGGIEEGKSGARLVFRSARRTTLGRNGFCATGACRGCRLRDSIADAQRVARGIPDPSARGGSRPATTPRAPTDDASGYGGLRAPLRGRTGDDRRQRQRGSGRGPRGGRTRSGALHARGLRVSRPLGAAARVAGECASPGSDPRLPGPTLRGPIARLPGGASAYVSVDARTGKPLVSYAPCWGEACSAKL